jgi:anti-sigma factor RsiW
MTTLPDPESVVLRHISDEDLLAYLDGELSGEAHQDAAHHLTRCWDCRTKLAAIQDRIDSFMQVRRSLSPEALEPEESAVAELQRRLARHAAAAQAETRAPRARPWLLAIPSRPAFAMLTLAIVVIVAAVAWFNAPLSADAVLTRAEVEETSAARQASAVVKNVIQIDRVDSTGSRRRLSVVSTMADNASPALSVSIGTADGAVEQDVLASNAQLLLRVTSHIRFGQPLTRYVVEQQWVPGVSAVEYRKLIRDRGVEEAFAERTGAIVELRHPFRPGHPSGVVETRLRLDGSSWIPVEISIVVVEDGARQEYRLTRTGVELLARTDALAALFASAGSRGAPPGGLAAPPDPTALPHKRARPLSYDSSVATPLEVDVALALHKARADLGEEINVFQMSDGTVLVQGVLDRQERRRQLLSTLHALDGVHVELYAPGTQTGRRTMLFDPPWRSSLPPALRMPPPDAPPIRVADFAGATMPMYSILREHFAPRAVQSGAQGSRSAVDEAIAAFATGVLRRSSDMLFQAWALRKLELQFSERRAQELPVSSRDQIERLRRAHLETLSGHARELSALLDDVVPRVPRDPLQTADRSAASLLSLASEQHQLVRSLFTASSAPGEPSAAVGRLKSLLTQIEAAGS